MGDATTIHLLRYTPIGDLVRGRVTGRLDVRSRIAEANLPAPAAELVARVVGRTRLWRSERLEVADELASHFADGLATGENADELVRKFGDERAAASLIRRAVRRGRPLPIRVLQAVGLAALSVAGVLAACLGAAYLRHASGEASPSVDYVAQVNFQTLATPVEERAWPLYREAMLGLGFPIKGEDAAIWRPMTDWSEGDAEWPPVVAWLDAHAADVAKIRAAADRPTLGFLAGEDGDWNDAALWPEHPALREKFVAARETAWSGRLGNEDSFATNVLSRLGSVLQADARAAREAGDARRLAADLTALLRASRQPNGLNSGDQVYNSLSGESLHAVELTLQEAPALLDDAMLRDLAHELARPERASDLVNLDRDRLNFHDQLQRHYTDDGAGDGRLTPDGLRQLHGWATAGTPWGRSTSLAYRAWAQRPEMVALSSRRDVARTYDALMDDADVLLTRPRREADWAAWEARLDALRRPGNAAYLAIPLALQGDLAGMHGSLERRLGHRDGLLVGIALELHRRRTGGAYPATLDAMVPALLPRVPDDRITGEPLRYRLIDGRPVVYSVGVDGDDDGGRAPIGDDGKPAPWQARPWMTSQAPEHSGGAARPPSTDGDWILYDGRRPLRG